MKENADMTDFRQDAGAEGKTGGPKRFGRVALMGPPNAGKSTLVNALVGQKVAIVSDKPQTTRNSIAGILSTERGQAVLVDTPGLRGASARGQGQLGRIMNRSAWQSLEGADAVLLVLDGDLCLRRPEALERDNAALLAALKEEERPVFVVVNKVDLFHDKSRMLPLLQELSTALPRAEIFPLSALHRDGVTALRDLLLDALPEGDPLFPEDQVSTSSLRFMAAEIIREQLFNRLYQEVPYSVAVSIENWEEVKDLIVIHAAVHVARASHKAMVIGRGGQGIKAIGTAARKEIAALAGRRVHLELWVKVRESWAEDQDFLQELFPELSDGALFEPGFGA